MASPHVAAVASLLWMLFPNCTNNNIRNVLSATALDIEDEGCDQRSGHGLIQAKDAYDLLSQGNCAADIGAISPVGGCGQLVKPCQSNAECDDGDSCTEDTCELATGVCANDQLSCGDCGRKIFRIDILTDYYPEEVSWDIKDSGGNKIKEGKAGTKRNALHTEEMCLENGSYVFTIKDTYGGICCASGNGVLSLHIDDIKIYENKKFDTNKEVVPFDVTDFITSFPTSVPTVCNGETVSVKVKTDYFPAEAWWDIKLGIEIVYQSGFYRSSLTKYKKDMCLEDGLYLFTIYDSYGNGLCCEYGKGSYELLVGDKTIKKGGKFLSKEETEFIVGESTLSPKKKRKKNKKKKSKNKKKKSKNKKKKGKKKKLVKENKR